MGFTLNCTLTCDACNNSFPVDYGSRDLLSFRPPGFFVPGAEGRASWLLQTRDHYNDSPPSPWHTVLDWLPGHEHRTLCPNCTIRLRAQGKLERDNLDADPPYEKKLEKEQSRYAVGKTGETVIDQITGLEWQREMPTKGFTQLEAKAYAEALDLAGGGWRLPSIAELFSLVDYSRYNPAIDPIAFPKTPPEYFWTGAIHAQYPSSAWFVSFYCGLVGFGVTALYSRIRCVRKVQS